MRIVSLLPSLTELVAALGKRDWLVGVTHECDFPTGVEALPHLTKSRIQSSAASAEIDALVSAERGSLYELDAKLLETLRPDLILTQAQCDVCAVNERTVRQIAAQLPGSPHVESVNPTTLAGVLEMFHRVGELLNAPAQAGALVTSFATTSATIARRLANCPPRKTLLLEWIDPPFSSGHWNPEIVALAGGIEVLGQPGERSRRLTWSEVASSNPHVILLSPCGFTLERSQSELKALYSRPEWTNLRAVQAGQVALIDGSAYFSRPGPRLEASLKIAAAAIHPEMCADLATSEDWLRPSGSICA